MAHDLWMWNISVFNKWLVILKRWILVEIIELGEDKILLESRLHLVCLQENAPEFRQGIEGGISDSL